MKIILNLAFVIVIFSLASCSNTKNLPAGDALYTGASVKIKNDIAAKKKKALQEDLTGLTRPKPNSTFLGMRLKLSFFNMAKVVS
jgi:outer membrane protein insertion porin family